MFHISWVYMYFYNPYLHIKKNRLQLVFCENWVAPPFCDTNEAPADDKCGRYKW